MIRALVLSATLLPGLAAAQADPRAPRPYEACGRGDCRPASAIGDIDPRPYRRPDDPVRLYRDGAYYPPPYGYTYGSAKGFGWGYSYPVRVYPGVTGYPPR